MGQQLPAAAELPERKVALFMQHGDRTGDGQAAAGALAGRQQPSRLWGGVACGWSQPGTDVSPIQAGEQVQGEGGGRRGEHAHQHNQVGGQLCSLG
jgi:hypothetical protein